MTDREKHEANIGKWVRFQKNGHCVIGVVQYVMPMPCRTWELAYVTDIGTIPVDDVLEMR